MAGHEVIARRVVLLGGSAMLAAALRALFDSFDSDEQVTEVDELKDWSWELDADTDAVVVDLPLQAQLPAVERIRAGYHGRLVVVLDSTDEHPAFHVEHDCVVVRRPIDMAELSALLSTDPSSGTAPVQQPAAIADRGRGAPDMTASTGWPAQAPRTGLAIRKPSVAPVPVALAGTSLLLTYLAAVAAIELAWRPLGIAVLASAAGHGLLALLLCLVPQLTTDSRTVALLPPLVAISTIRLITFAALPADVHPLLRLVVVGIPALIAVTMSVRMRLPEWPLLRPHRGGWRAQGLVTLLGIPLAVLIWVVAPPGVQVATGASSVAAAMVLVFAALPDELLYRGLLVPAGVGVAGSWGLPLSSLAYALAYLPGGSPRTVLLAFVLGMVLGWCRRRTGSVVGVVAAHGLVNVLVYLILPLSGS